MEARSCSLRKGLVRNAWTGTWRAASMVTLIGNAGADDDGKRFLRDDDAGGLDAVHDGHRDVEDEEIGGGVANQFHGFRAVARGAGDVVPEAGEDGAQRIQHRRFVVGDQYG